MSGIFTCENCLFGSNSAQDGGAIWLSAGSYSSLVANTVFVDNEAVVADLEWKGMEDWATGGAVHIVSTTAPLALVNVISAGNVADEFENFYGNVEVTHSLVEDGWEGDGNIDGDPLFTDAENGDFSLLPGSPCIDAADGEVAPEFDIDGNPRVDDPGSPNTGIGPPWADMGAYEHQP